MAARQALWEGSRGHSKNVFSGGPPPPLTPSTDPVSPPGPSPLLGQLAVGVSHLDSAPSEQGSEQRESDHGVPLSQAGA